ncbi:WD40 repeat-like protein [Thelephora ganbajun]|uniref:WD40 repeat-like protein n=1 Tax=Thelephora ganbajun TaxID=370292 RepID=A0ACB6ZCR7_THEGA|nr:WD40 repeat-like protein [Thelephora ganbajun]
MASFRKGISGGNTSPGPSTLYIPIASPPTPAPSPGPFTHNHDHNNLSVDMTHFPLVKGVQKFAYDPTHDFSSLDEQARLEYLNKIIAQCTLKELSYISTIVNPLLKRDFLRELPVELALHILSYIDDLYELVGNVAGVCKHWRRLSNDNWLWKRMCQRWGFEVPLHLEASEDVAVPGSAKRHFKILYLQRMRWLHGGTPLRNHRLPISQPDMGVVTSLAMDKDWIVAGLADTKIHVFSCRTGVLSRTLVGCQGGVWAVWLIEKGSWSSPSPRKKNTNSGSAGWGQKTSLVVSGGCDKVVRVWDVETGRCIHTLEGHRATIRCVSVLDHRPIAVSGSRDSTLRVWDIDSGQLLRVLEGHQSSVRCMDAHGSIVVSGSYDNTCRVWDIDTGLCLHVLRGHLNQIYCVSYDGIRIASGGLDTHVRIWDPVSGACLALLQGHTALVCQIQLSPTILATGGSDGRVITFSLETYSILQRIAAHDSSVTTLQFDENFLVTGGNDGRVRLFETKTGKYFRDLTEPAESVWKVGYAGNVCAIMCKRARKTVMEVWSYDPPEVELEKVW